MPKNGTGWLSIRDIRDIRETVKIDNDIFQFNFFRSHENGGFIRKYREKNV